MAEEKVNASEKDTATEKALKILECFIPNNTELGNAEITELTGYHRATTSRTIKTLEKNGYLHQNKTNKKYKLGAKIKQLNDALSQSLDTDLVVEISPILLALRNRTGESVVFEQIKGKTVVPSLTFRGRGPLFVDIPVGLPVIWNTSTGLIAMLAFADDNLKERFMSQPMFRATDESVTDLEKYKSRLEDAKKMGYATTVDEPVVGIVSYACPIFDYSGTPVASVNIAGPKERLLENRADIIAELKKAVEQVSELFKF